MSNWIKIIMFLISNWKVIWKMIQEVRALFQQSDEAPQEIQKARSEPGFAVIKKAACLADQCE